MIVLTVFFFFSGLCLGFIKSNSTLAEKSECHVPLSRILLFQLILQLVVTFGSVDDILRAVFCLSVVVAVT